MAGQDQCKGGPVQLLLVEYDEQNNELEVWAERLDEVSRDFFIDPWNQVLECVRCAGRAMLCAMCSVSCM
jgi:hypothetical protein